MTTDRVLTLLGLDFTVLELCKSDIGQPTQIVQVKRHLSELAAYMGKPPSQEILHQLRVSLGDAHLAEYCRSDLGEAIRATRNGYNQAGGASKATSGPRSHGIVSSDDAAIGVYCKAAASAFRMAESTHNRARSLANLADVIVKGPQTSNAEMEGRPLDANLQRAVESAREAIRSIPTQEISHLGDLRLKAHRAFVNAVLLRNRDSLLSDSQEIDQCIDSLNTVRANNPDVFDRDPASDSCARRI
ncbi:hypothetical protein FA15DRAFT_654592 [Coprinopsis marcescibilis]|uniref:Uncharacterized protein n=1 Tax=Coprinopsis marcescibilis TaxID=230819 RepID=A0A5C3L1N3_COPMA|nr:hypothetical protein FA15DRAFT_654592 [Coprinopsis marcescibilis]